MRSACLFKQTYWCWNLLKHSTFLKGCLKLNNAVCLRLKTQAAALSTGCCKLLVLHLELSISYSGTVEQNVRLYRTLNKRKFRDVCTETVCLQTSSTNAAHWMETTPFKVTPIFKIWRAIVWESTHMERGSWSIGSYQCIHLYHKSISVLVHVFCTSPLT